MFYIRKGIDIYHWRMDCSQVPGNVHYDQYWVVLPKYAAPSGKACKECMEKGKREM